MSLECSCNWSQIVRPLKYAGVVIISELPVFKASTSATHVIFVSLKLIPTKYPILIDFYRLQYINACLLYMSKSLKKQWNKTSAREKRNNELYFNIDMCSRAKLHVRTKWRKVKRQFFFSYHDN